MSDRNEQRPPGILKNDYFDAVASPRSMLGLSHQTESPKSTPKSVSIAPGRELISPLMLGNTKDVEDLDLDRTSSPRKPKIKGPLSKRMSGRRSHQASVSSLPSLVDESNDAVDSEAASSQADQHLFNSGLVGQVAAWIREEKVKRDSRKHSRRSKHHLGTKVHHLSPFHHTDGVESRTEHMDHARRDSDASEEDVDLDKLEQILKETFPFRTSSARRGSTSIRRRPSARKLHKSSSAGLGAASSDTEYHDGDALVPTTDAILDNSQTLGYSGGGAAQSTDDLSLTRQMTASEEAWGRFKFEIVRLTHTLRLKGWRRVPMEMSAEIEVSRLSGALTNAVYVVSPPDTLPQQSSAEEGKPTPKKIPPKLLLRIYGPQVEHLIDRESELQILRRLSRKKIGPRLLGTFGNGRFEQFLNARPLTPPELRNSDTSRHIAKRMRELHDGIDLLDSERNEGPFVWQNWDKWLQRVGDVASWLDAQMSNQQGRRGSVDAWKDRGFACGTEWSVFKKTVQRYRVWLEEQCGGFGQLREDLVFAHNDTQYGNILRLLPSDTSPLLLPANTHKQLVVIDFEYANANTPGLEFANHFTEWCYNYHDEATPWRCNTSAYPTPEEQNSFLRAYVRHRPEFNISTPKMKPMATVPESRTISPNAPIEPSPASHDVQAHRPEIHSSQRRPGPTSSISDFMLDARGPPSSKTSSTSAIPPTSNLSSLPPPSIAAIEASDDSSKHETAEVKRLYHETRIWRPANTAQWVAWGIVQAKVPGMPLFSPQETEDAGEARKAGIDEVAQGGRDAEMADGDEEEEEEAKEAEFDYLAYARDRAMFFWGDAVTLGLVALEELPADVRRDIKIVKY